MRPYRRDQQKKNFPSTENEDLYATEKRTVFRKKDFHKNKYSHNDEHYHDRHHETQ